MGLCSLIVNSVILSNTMVYPACQISIVSCSLQWPSREDSADIQSFHEELNCWYNKNTCITFPITTQNYITLHY